MDVRCLEKEEIFPKEQKWIVFLYTTGLSLLSCLKTSIEAYKQECMFSCLTVARSVEMWHIGLQRYPIA